MAAERARRRTPAQEAKPVPALATTPGEAAEFDPLVHERMRLAILGALAGRDAVAFSELKSITGATDGNLSVHARRLEDAGYLVCTKSFAGRVPRTEFRITAAGRHALDRYLDHMEALIRRVREG